MTKKLHTSDKIYIGRSEIEGAGRGVFAKTKIKKGEVIEKCPFLEIYQDDQVFKSNSLIEYLFFFGKNKESAALALGFGSLYNHSEKPNAKFKINPDEKIIEFSSLKDIKRGEEITINYRGRNNKKAKKNPLWFEE